MAHGLYSAAFVRTKASKALCPGSTHSDVPARARARASKERPTRTDLWMQNTHLFRTHVMHSAASSPHNVDQTITPDNLGIFVRRSLFRQPPPTHGSAIFSHHCIRFRVWYERTHTFMAHLCDGPHCLNGTHRAPLRRTQLSGNVVRGPHTPHQSHCQLAGARP